MASINEFLFRRVDQTKYTDQMPVYPGITLASHVAIKGDRTISNFKSNILFLYFTFKQCLIQAYRWVPCLVLVLLH